MTRWSLLLLLLMGLLAGCGEHPLDPRCDSHEDRLIPNPHSYLFLKCAFDGNAE